MSKTHHCHCISHIFPQGTAQHYVKWVLQLPSISYLGWANPEALLSPPAPSQLTSQPFTLASPHCCGAELMAASEDTWHRQAMPTVSPGRLTRKPAASRAEPTSEETLLAGGRRGQGGCWGYVGSLCALTPRAAADQGQWRVLQARKQDQIQPSLFTSSVWCFSRHRFQCSSQH